MMDMISRFFSPPDLGGPHTEQHRIVLRAFSVVALLAGFILGLKNASAGFNHLALSLFILSGVSMLSLWLIRHGRLIAPSFLLPFSALLVLTSNLIVGGSLQESESLVYAVVIVFASLLLGKRAALLFAGFSVFSQVLVFFALSSGLVAEAVGVQQNFSGLVITSLLIGLMAAFLWILLDSLERSVERARSSEARWRSLVENAPVTIVNTDRDGIVQFFNNFGGVKVGEIIGKPLVEFVPAIDYKRAIAVSRQVLRSGESTHLEISGRDLDDKITFYGVSVGPILGPRGEIDGLTFILLDITEKKRSEDEIQRLNSELKQLVQERTTQLEISNQELASLSYSVSHDLRTPLRAIDGFSLALLEDYKAVLDDQGQDYLKRVRAASQRMGILIDDLLRLASIARQKFKSQPVDLSALVNTVASQLTTKYPERSVELLVEPDLHVHADPNLLQIAITNLFKNAWMFTSLEEGARIEFGCQEIDGSPIYYLRDNGIGFDMQYAAKLFQPFQHLHRRSELEGSGVGLAIVQRIIQKHGGKIWAEAQEDQGATFYFALSS